MAEVHAGNSTFIQPSASSARSTFSPSSSWPICSSSWLRAWAEREFDDILCLGILIAGLGARIKVPAETGNIARGANQKCGLFKKAVVRNQAQGARFNVGRSVERIHQQAERALVERDGHGVDGKVAAAQILLNGSGVEDGLARLGILARWVLTTSTRTVPGKQR